MNQFQIIQRQKGELLYKRSKKTFQQVTNTHNKCPPKGNMLQVFFKYAENFAASLCDSQVKEVENFMEIARHSVNSCMNITDQLLTAYWDTNLQGDPDPGVR